MKDKYRIGVICDLHLTEGNRTAQHAFLRCAAQRMRQEGADAVICPGDVTACGELEGYEAYREILRDFSLCEAAGNSDVRDPASAETMVQLFQNRELILGKRKVIGVNTPYGRIADGEKERLRNVKPGDLVFLHHDPESLEEESRNDLTALAEQVPITILHGHAHQWMDRRIGNSRVIGVKCLDPDKCIGSFPALTWLTVSEEEIDLRECQIGVPRETMEDVRRYFGISCVDNQADVAYALEHGIPNIELRCIDDWTPDWTILPLIEEWRKQTKGYLSVHMPDIRIRDGEVVGKEQWYQALEYACLVNADGLTMHPPRVKKSGIPYGGARWNEILTLYFDVVRKVRPGVKLGIENLHMNPGEAADGNRGFGYIPEEVSLWINELNRMAGESNRVGHVLDVGHARNNGLLAQKYPVSRWYERMGQKTVAYHIHQVVPFEDGYKNHCAIEEWFGPMINYTSFFWCWQQRILNHVPVFLEVKGHENFEISVQAFERLLVRKDEEVCLVPESNGSEPGAERGENMPGAERGERVPGAE
ncbi:MAG: metallophosphoesterase family protein [Lachnospiraceae bacterium]|nr:metallophosphoesterase family protein [Lachnospiraceae bacterium]